MFGLGDDFSRVRLDLVVNILTTRAMKNEPLTVFGGEQWRPILHVKDVGEALFYCLENEVTGLFNLSYKNVKIYEIAEEISQNKDLVVINGAEITRMFPPGHINAVFIEDANKLIYLDESKIEEAKQDLEKIPEEDLQEYKNQSWLEDAALANLWPVKEALKEARKQKAFTFWNHPAWSSEEFIGEPMVRNVHKDFFESELLHGIEVANGDGYSEEAFQIALDYGLTILGTSDVHGLIDWDYPPAIGAHRPVTLILAKNRSNDAVKSALFAGKTVVWYKNNLIGLQENVTELTNAYLKARKVEILSKLIGFFMIFSDEYIGYQLIIKFLAT